MMALSPTHKFGQMLGAMLEAGIAPALQAFADQHGLYLDRKGPRPARRGRKVSWQDRAGNVHDLDFVLEKGGTAATMGTPVAFIEVAWRRYTRHSRNKAQEIQGAIVPLAETYAEQAPFLGAVLAGVFTAAALQQLRSQGFAVLYYPYAAVLDVFRQVGIDAAFDENSPDEIVEHKVRELAALPPAARVAIGQAIVATDASGWQQFMAALGRAVGRQVATVLVSALHGPQAVLTTVGAALALVEGYQEAVCEGPFQKYEIEVRYNNGDLVRGAFGGKDAALDFLRRYAPPSTPA